MRRQFLQRRFHQLFVRGIAPIERHFKRCLQPAIVHPTLGAVMDVTRSQSELIAENAFLRQQLVISAAADETPHAHPLGSWTAGLVRQPIDEMEGCAAHRQARPTRPPRKPTQTWGTFLKNHAHEIWACDFLQTYDLWFRSLFVFFIIGLGSLRVVHFAVTYSLTDVWVAQQLREVTPFDTRPRFLIRDNDRNLALSLLVQRAALRYYARRFALPKRMPCVSVF